MAKAIMTETDALALCIARPMTSAKAFNADVAKQACDNLAKLFKADRIDTDTFSRINARIGNHSAMRQWAVKQGIIPAADIAEDALARAVKALVAKSDKELEEMVKA